MAGFTPSRACTVCVTNGLEQVSRSRQRGKEHGKRLPYRSLPSLSSGLTAAMAYQAYNPLDKIHLVEDVVRALLARPVIDLPPPSLSLELGSMHCTTPETSQHTSGSPSRTGMMHGLCRYTWAKPCQQGQGKAAMGWEQHLVKCCIDAFANMQYPSNKQRISPSVTLDAGI